jgi:hypothetical protein
LEVIHLAHHCAARASSFSAFSAALRPKWKNAAGVTARSSKVEEIRPPMKTNCHWVQNLFARFLRRENERDERNACRQRCHEDWDKPLQRPADHHLAGKAFPLVPHEMEVMGEHHDAVPRRNAADGDESHESGNGDIVDLPPGENEAAHERERDIDQHLRGEHRTAKIAIERKLTTSRTSAEKSAMRRAASC